VLSLVTGSRLQAGSQEFESPRLHKIRGMMTRLNGLVISHLYDLRVADGRIWEDTTHGRRYGSRSACNIGSFEGPVLALRRSDSSYRFCSAAASCWRIGSDTCE
jgi:hypothetical protein